MNGLRRNRTGYCLFISQFYFNSSRGAFVVGEIVATKVVSQAKLAGKVDEVIVLSWSDLEYPSKNATTLPREQRNLAGERNRAIKSYLQSSRDVDVDTYNMAEKPNTLSKWFDTSDNQLKRAFLRAGLPTTQDSPKLEGKASRSVILVKIE